MQEPMNPQTEEKKRFWRTKKGKAVWILSLSAFLLTAAFFFVLNFDRIFSLFVKEPEPSLPETKEEITPVIADDEIRGVYIASVFNINFPSRKGLSEDALKKELDTIVEESRDTGLDTIYFQVRPSGDALYRSNVFPTSRYLAAKEGDEISFDPLSYLIEKAADFEMEVVAWINPYRVTASSADSKEEALATLSENNPAKLHPDWTVFYGGKLYYDPALPQVRELIASGVKEICEGYEVAGVLYDDYFYPYPVSGEEFDDTAAYEESGTELSLGDWRRENVNQMVRLTFDIVKGTGFDLTFGISPFGIWKNASSDPKGSDTHGMEAYFSLYCDALAWIEGGYIDYISPQIYWEQGNSAADFATLTRWWSAQVDGTGVGLVISHAAYRVGEFQYGGDEIAQQIRYARNYIGSCGSIQYGFEDIQKNTQGVRDALRNLFHEPFLEESGAQPVTGISFVRPANGLNTTESAQFVSILSDPAFPVYSETGKIGRTKSGFISVLLPLALGENTLTLSQNGVEYSLTVNRQRKMSDAVELENFQIAEVTPSVQDGVIASSGVSIPVSVTAPAGSTVFATLMDQRVALTPSLKPAGDGKYLKEVYVGSITVPTVPSGADLVTVGNLQYSSTFEGNTDNFLGAEVRVIPASLTVKATVKKDYSHLKISPDSSFYEDYTPASVGMCDEVIAFYDGYYLLGFGGFIAKDNVTLEHEGSFPESVLDRVTSRADTESSDFTLKLGASPAITGVVEEDTVKITVFRTTTNLDGKIALSSEDRLFSSASLKASEEGDRVILTLKLRSVRNYYGFDYRYEEGSVILSFRQPSGLSEGESPLKGKTIVIDAGHGGTDLGALGFYPDQNEKDLNLAIALFLRDKVEALGGTAVMIREDDSTVSLTDRMLFLTKTNPSLSISVHHNSAYESSDANAARGTLGLYWSPAGLSLAETVQENVKSALGARDLGARSQMLALCRNHRFPQTLVEVSFICSPAEYERSMRSDYAELCADAIAEGILDWYRMQEEYLQEVK